jgi:hypothetical protein
MEKVLLVDTSDTDWETIGVFDDLDDVKRYIKEEYEMSFDEDIDEFDNFEHWLEEVLEIQIIYKRMLK